MSLKAQVLVATDNEETASSIASSLKMNSRFALGSVCRGLHDLVAHMERFPVPAVLVDIDSDPLQILASLDPICRRFNDTLFIVLSQTLRDDLMLEAMQVGARHYLLKHSISSDLGNVLQRLIPSDSAKPGMRGHVVTVLSASGGCGATTLSVNLANELHLLAAEPALLVDLDCSYGGMATYLGLRGQYGLADVLARNGELDAQLIRSTALEYSEGLRVLINPTTINLVSPAQLEYQRLQDTIQVCRESYKWTVIDAPRVSMKVAADLITASDVTLMVLQLTVKDIGMARAMLLALKEQGVSQNLVAPVVNRYQKRRTMITLEEARKALDETPLQCVSNDFGSAIKSLNYGQPLAKSAPRSTLHRELKQLANKVFEAGSKHTRSILSG